MRHEIAVSVRRKIAEAEKDALYVCGNSDFVIVFDLDEDWDEHETKTARFTWNGGRQDVIFEGNECPVPVISNTYSFGVGIFAGNLETSTPARVPCKKSILCSGGPPHDPPPDVYAQIMAMLSAGASDEQIEAAVDKYLKENPIDDALPAVTEEDDGKILMVKGGAWTPGELPKYDGAYEVTPLADEATTLLTKEKYLDSNVTVNKVPYYETSNNEGGETVYIAREVDIYGD